MALCALVGLLALAAPAAAETLPAHFESHELVGGLWFPTGVAWGPGGRMYVIQKDGEVFTVAPGSSTPEPLLNISDQVNFYGDRGLLGVAVDSQFTSHHYLYLLYTHKRFGYASQDGDPMNSQLMRVELNAAGDQVVGQQTILGTAPDGASACPAPANDVDCIPSESDTHSIGTVRSAPDGTLFVGAGDGAQWTAADPNALRTYNEQSLSGKILHIDRDGHGLTGHPFCPADSNPTHVCTKVYAKGFRNPYRFKLRPGGGLTVGDVGWSEREEIDLVGAGGGNYGWPCYEGGQHTPGYREMPACALEYAKEGTPAQDVLPDFDYPHPADGDPSPPPLSGNTALGGPTYEGDEYPSTYKDTIFVGDYGVQQIRTLRPQASGPPAVDVFGSDMGWIVDLDTAPDGNLVYASLGDFSATGGSIQEIGYSPNHSPVADARSDVTQGVAPLDVQFDGSQSSDAEDGKNLTYHWNFGDGGSSNDPSPAHIYQGVGRYTATLKVTDTEGATGTDSVIVQVGAPPENVEISSSVPKYTDGQPVTLTASATDDGPLTDSSFTWQLLLRHLSHYHPFTSQSGHAITFTPPTDHDSDAFVDITLTVTDSDGLVTTKKLRLDPRTAPFNLLSAPGGASMDYAGKSVTGPFHKQAAVGFQGSVSTAGHFSEDGHEYEFSGWDRGGSRLLNFTVPVGGLTLTAHYRDLTPTVSAPILPAPDRSGPRLRFRHLDARKGLLSGTTSDGAGVRSVYVALGRAGTHGRCRWWVSSAGRLGRALTSCSKPRWIRARLSGSHWTASLRRKRVPAGGYRLVFRAVDKLGNVSRRLTDGSRLERVQVKRGRRAH